MLKDTPLVPGEVKNYTAMPSKPLSLHLIRKNNSLNDIKGDGQKEID